jgi:hypothetical protein
MKSKKEVLKGFLRIGKNLYFLPIRNRLGRTEIKSWMIYVLQLHETESRIWRTEINFCPLWNSFHSRCRQTNRMFLSPSLYSCQVIRYGMLLNP